MRTVLVSLLAECINSKSGTSEPQPWPVSLDINPLQLHRWLTVQSAPEVKERELVTLLNLVNMALQRIPRIVSDDDGATLLTIIGQTTSLLAEERLAYVLPFFLLLPPHMQSPCIALSCAWHIRTWSHCRNIHSYLLKTLQSMAGILASINTPALCQRMLRSWGACPQVHMINPPQVLAVEPKRHTHVLTCCSTGYVVSCAHKFTDVICAARPDSAVKGLICVFMQTSDASCSSWQPLALLRLTALQKCGAL